MKVAAKSKMLGLMAAIAAPFATSTAMAHHSLAGEFDTTKSIELRGTITKVEWTNPHIYIYVDMVDKGETVHWQCEMGSPNQLIRQGSKKTDLPVGTIIRAQANPARDGSKTCSTRKITLDDGKPVFTRTGAYGGQGLFTL
jgi:hypothetical protein